MIMRLEEKYTYLFYQLNSTLSILVIMYLKMKNLNVNIYYMIMRLEEKYTYLLLYLILWQL